MTTNLFVGRISMLARFTVSVVALLAGSFAIGAESGSSAHEFEFTSIDGTPLPLSNYRGKIVLVVNTASRCGFTSQYAGLQNLWERYRNRGLVVLGVPSNDFGNQEPGSEAEIKRFCKENFGVDFPMTSKVSVRGGAVHPFYAWVAGLLGSSGMPRWNFQKYLIGPDGRLLSWYPPMTSPKSIALKRAIERQLDTLQ